MDVNVDVVGDNAHDEVTLREADQPTTPPTEGLSGGAEVTLREADQPTTPPTTEGPSGGAVEVTSSRARPDLTPVARRTCPFCNVIFVNAQQKHHHMFTQHNGYEYSCRVCGYRTEWLSNVRRHVQARHGATKEDQRVFIRREYPPNDTRARYLSY